MFLQARAWQLSFEGDDDAAAKAAADAKTAADAKAADDAKNDDDKKFNQDDLNRFLAEDKRKGQEKQRQLALELVEMKKQKNLTDKQKGDLQAQIDDLQKQYMTTEEQARQDADRKQKEYSGKLETATTERDEWKAKHEQLAISTEIAHAAFEHEAVELEQVEAILRPKTKLVEKLDDEGQPTGQFEPKVTFNDIGKDEKPIVLELTVNEAVKRMRELPKHGNLFRSPKKGGLGGSGSQGPSGKQIDIAKLARTDQAAYRKLRKEKPELFDN